MRVPTGASLELARELAGDLVPTDAIERPITVDQTNHSVVVGEAVVVKWLRRPAPPPHRGARLLGHLDAVGFTAMPTFLGTAEEDGRVVAVLTAYVPGSRDGWEWYVDELDADLDAGDIGRSLTRAARVGTLAARLHRALATPSAVIPAPISRSGAAGEHRRGVALLDAALQLTVGDAGERLGALAPRIADDLDALATAGDVEVQPVHGDLHVGQLLRHADELLITDFDGDPVSADVAATVDGIDRRPSVVDLASLVQSVDHVARILARRRPERTAQLDDFATGASTAVIWAYGAGARFAEELLRPLQVVQELHELVYAARHLPQWRYVPDAALAALYR